MKMLFDRVNANTGVQSESNSETILKFKTLELEQTKVLYEVKSQYEVRVSSLEKDISIL